ncbi:MAG: indole-3-glycerol phosphate synthase / phosphoribosylanthranilate isomerase [archaeon GW2011_AR10]|uniref:N-(5'-phosphoribosyl)anthranilate isomerase n=1 Tax=Candidatus Iainarchaeum sp. TaxID=3101447 RepID=A0A7J4ITI2_9ARCH|nr:MAG: indole-3-glycerol phosphate synthase / phosphoribosylanthranilate isomerase [archaeon GW2011_AR10]HIH08821.1 bifunctional indole-3-glycerol-phosphate synthase TrpC/phosphoribosylanthranilate isomerase TrpF [Candidatus Diapherotrites archaeon]
MNFLEKIVKEKRREVERAKIERPLGSFRSKLRKSSLSFRNALKKKGIALIAEVKVASPSRGTIRENFNLKETLKLYNDYADAISIITDRKFFKGSLDYLKEASVLAKKPLLRKDFIIDEYQLFESRLFGADAVLFIANILSAEKIDDFIKTAKSLGMDCLVEADSLQGMKKILGTKAEIIGINNRSLSSFKMDSGKTGKLARVIPRGKRKKIVLVAESGFSTRESIEGVKGVADSVLIGTAIMEFPCIRTKLRELSGKTLVKVCGITNEKDAVNAVKLGADFVGINFYRKSPRYVNPFDASKLVKKLNGKAVVVGVFVNEAPKNVKDVARKCGLDMLQFSGNESEKYVKQFGFPSVKAFHVEGAKSLEEAANSSADFILLDSFVSGKFGGTGKTFNHKLLNGTDFKGKRVFISGGITPKNVVGVLKKFRPFAVDVASGVESRPGKKSFSKVRELIRKVSA